MMLNIIPIRVDEYAIRRLVCGLMAITINDDTVPKSPIYSGKSRNISAFSSFFNLVFRLTAQVLIPEIIAPPK